MLKNTMKQLKTPLKEENKLLTTNFAIQFLLNQFYSSDIQD